MYQEILTTWQNWPVLIAIVVLFPALQIKNLQMLSFAIGCLSLLNALHLGLMGADSGSMVAFSGGITFMFQGLFKEKFSVKNRIFIALPTICMVVIFCKPGVLMFIPILASGMSQISAAVMSEKWMRPVLMVHYLLWIFYALASSTPLSMIYYIMGASSMGWAMLSSALQYREKNNHVVKIDSL
jgi:hypothetical protein